jgi:hypoxanthine-DNA glycosylase
VFGEPLVNMPYDQRLSRLLAHGIGLWDVFGACERAGSLDAAIRNAEANDVARLRRRLPTLLRVLFNGRTASRAAPHFAAAGLVTAVLPSTSPAHAALRLDAKVALWRAALRPDQKITCQTCLSLR